MTYKNVYTVPNCIRIMVEVDKNSARGIAATRPYDPNNRKYVVSKLTYMVLKWVYTISDCYLVL